LEMALTFIKIYADGVKRALLGSDFPIFSPAETLQSVRTLQRSSQPEVLDEPLITQQELELILGGNAASLLKLN